MEVYYYSKMDKTKQAVYHAMLQGLLALEDSIPMPRLEAEDLYQVFFLLRLDHPEIFWATGYKYRYYPESANLVFLPEYLFEKGKIREHQKAMKARVEKLARAAQNLSEWEKEKYVHDFICENVHYDKLKKPYSHEIIGPLGQGVGGNRKVSKGALRCAWRLVRDCSVRKLPREGDQIPPYVEHCKNRRAVLSSGCYI